MGVFVRVILFFSIIIVAYYTLRYIFSPKRKLELAHQNREFYMLDNFNKVDRNMLITYRGVMFEGKKHLGTAEDAFRVIHIVLWAQEPKRIHGLSKKDCIEIEQKVFQRYPYATLEWKSPIKELMDA